MNYISQMKSVSSSLLKGFKSSIFTMNNIRLNNWPMFLSRYNSRRKPDVSHIPELNEPPLKKFYEAYYQPNKGRVHDKKPWKLKCEKGKLYYWCVCGWSHDQPLCDGRCILPEMKIKLKPVLFKPAQTREYWLCNCKQTNNRPFCDGSHTSEFVQSSHSVIRR